MERVARTRDPATPLRAHGTHGPRENTMDDTDIEPSSDQYKCVYCEKDAKYNEDGNYMCEECKKEIDDEEQAHSGDPNDGGVKLIGRCDECGNIADDISRDTGNCDDCDYKKDHNRIDW